MSNKDQKDKGSLKHPVLTGAGVLAAVSLSMAAIAAEPDVGGLFQADHLDRGFMLAGAGFGEGACGEGSCGEEDHDDEDQEDQDDKDEEGACGEGTCGEGKCGG